IYGLPGFDPVNLVFFKPGKGLKRQRTWDEVEVISPDDDLSKQGGHGDSTEEGWESEGEEEGEEAAMTLTSAVLSVAHDK
ncbi:hypothetical protein PQX77_015587, partial [Marasmius sp. AFHP31]